MGTSNNVWTWSRTAGSNTTADAGINWAEGMLPPAINDSARGMMAAIANFRDDLGAITTTGSANSYSLTTNSGFTALATGLIVIAKINATNTGASTINVDGLGAKAIRKITTGGEGAMGSGDLQATGAYLLRYDTALNSAAGAWLCLNPPSATGTTALGGTGRLYGSNTTSSNLTDITVGTGLTMTGSTLSCTVTAGTGTVTSVGTGTGLTGGPITGSGTISVSLTGSGGVNVSGATISLNTNNAVGIGCQVVLYNLTGSSVASGSTMTTNGTNATYVKWNVSGTGATNGNVPTGQVWRNVSGGTIANNEAGEFIRVS